MNWTFLHENLIITLKRMTIRFTWVFLLTRDPPYTHTQTHRHQFSPNANLWKNSNYPWKTFLYCWELYHLFYVPCSQNIRIPNIHWWLTLPWVKLWATGRSISITTLLQRTICIEVNAPVFHCTLWHCLRFFGYLQTFGNTGDYL